MASERPGSMDEILAAARQRRQTPLQKESPAGPAPSPRADISVALADLIREVEDALGARVTAVKVQLRRLRDFSRDPASVPDPCSIWTTLEELEDQLEALLR